MRYSFLTIAAVCGLSIARAAEPVAATHFRDAVQPVLSEHCFDCHADGMTKGNVDFDLLKLDPGSASNRELWLKVLKNVRAGLMPPSKKPRLSPEEQSRLETWIKHDAFAVDPANPDPGRVTVRRLNRVEYRNTIRDLMGVEFDTDNEFPPDDTGYGFDNISDVLTVSPMLLEKYLAAAKTIVNQTVPTVAKTMPERVINGRQFRQGDEKTGRDGGGNKQENRLILSYYEPASVSNTFRIEHEGHYKLTLDLAANEKFVEGQFDYNKCRVVFKADGHELMRRDYMREGGRTFHYDFETDWQPGEHALALELEPLTSGTNHVRSLTMRLDAVTLRGPLDEKYWVRAKNYGQFFTKDPPKNPAERRAYARELLGAFAAKAFRRPADSNTVERLAKLAEGVYTQPGKTFEAGIAHGMVAVLASPRFLFREEGPDPARREGTYAFIDEYALASRLSYFLWSSMPDAELFRLAGAGELRKNLSDQVKRLLADSRSKAFIQNFTGQWLQARDVDNVVIDARSVLAREQKADPEQEQRRARFRELRNKPDESLTAEEKAEMAKMRLEFFNRAKPLRTELTGELRQGMRREMEMYFANIVKEDRSVVELVDSDYTYLNERLAKHYGLTNLDVTGDEMRKVTLPADSPRGGVLTMGGVLAVTSNPTRTSPVKRGLFILDNILGMPPPPPPPDIPPLEDAAKGVQGHELTLRETLELHRSKPLCSSCHNRMDPLGLALENFNALGMWREQEHEQPVDVTGKLLTGESFDNIRELKHILATQHRRDFYRCLAEKLLTYAIGRGLEYYDVETVDEIVARMENQDGRFSGLLMGIVESAPFQKRRDSGMLTNDKPARPAQQRADLKIKS